jgi:hypothetical protein
MASKKQEAALRVGAVVEDRDPRCPGRRGVVADVTKDRVTVAWNTGKTTRFARRTWGERFKVVE